MHCNCVPRGLNFFVAYYPYLQNEAKSSRLIYRQNKVRYEVLKIISDLENTQLPEFLLHEEPLNYVCHVTQRDMIPALQYLLYIIHTVLGAFKNS